VPVLILNFNGMKNSNQLQAQLVVQMWNTLDPSQIIDWVTEDVAYDSQFTLLSIDGKSHFQSHIVNKIQTIKESVDANKLSVDAYLVQLDKSDDEYFVYLTLQDNGKIYESLIKVFVNDYLISRIFISSIHPKHTLKFIEAA